MCRFQDPQIVESSGLVARDGLFATVNDSGDSGRVFVVDAETCRTVGITTLGRRGRGRRGGGRRTATGLLVGDIGDNLAARDSVQLLRVPAGPRGSDGHAHDVRDHAIPGGARDAEALLVAPDDRPGADRVEGASMAGVLYAAPERLSEPEPNRLRAIADVPGLVTDGAFFPDGRHFVLRTYSRAVFYTYPGLEAVGEVTLPDQEQGEGIAVDERSRVFLSSEGQQAPVLRIDAAAADRGAPRAARETEPARRVRRRLVRSGEPRTRSPDPERHVWPWLLRRARSGLARARGTAARAARTRRALRGSAVPRLRRTSPDEPGWTRRRAGAGFVYLDEHGDRLSAATMRSGARTW